MFCFWFVNKLFLVDNKRDRERHSFLFHISVCRSAAACIFFVNMSFFVPAPLVVGWSVADTANEHTCSVHRQLHVTTQVTAINMTNKYDLITPPVLGRL